MEMYTLADGKRAVPFFLEKTACAGVKSITEKVLADFEKVCGVKPALCEVGRDDMTHVSDMVFAGTLGSSVLLEKWFREDLLEVGNLDSEREVYSFQWIENPFSGSGRILVIAGSDKRGTLYGLFRLSELIGVSAMHYFGDAVIERRNVLQIRPESYFSKQPSVKYRGFFINDEWPAFGNWCKDTFGDVNAEAYDKIFELLLRMKGNYLWPAMWNSSFSEDGPGIKSAELADLYGVVMGTSHHEPLCRAGVEWQRQYQKYGDDASWDFIKNGQAISRFWEDGVIRNKPFENVITVGMRGENDSKLLAENATMAENIEVIKKAIRAQHGILRRQFGPDLSDVPRMLAVYKEVEQFYYGDESCEGLKDWDELKDVIFLLSDDNHGSLRALPTEKERNHPGGYGMYYHLDYHGGPISYEWVNSTKISKVWEQMTTAYEYGVREMWIVNVGDLKGVEYPLSFFMDLAYDYDTWGIQGREKVPSYPDKWLRSVLGSSVEASVAEDVKEVLNGYIEWNAVRRPEYTRADVYHPIHMMEGQRVMARCEELLEKAEALRSVLTGDCLEAYESTVYFPAAASLHLHLMNVCAGYNHLLAERGSLFANRMGDLALEHLHQMEQAVDGFHALKGGKWNHMMASAHTGFQTWDDYSWTYPVIHRVEPIPGGKALVSFRHSDVYDLGAHWQNTGCDSAAVSVPGEVLWIDIDSRGRMPFSFLAETDCSFLELSGSTGRVEPGETGRGSVAVCYRPRSADSGGTAAGSADKGFHRERTATVTVRIRFDDGSETEMKLQVERETAACGDAVGENCFVQTNGYIAIDAAHYTKKQDTPEGAYHLVPDRGRFQDAVKCFPVNKNFMGLKQSDRPSVSYSFCVPEGAAYDVLFEMVPANPDHYGGRFAFHYSVNGQELVYCPVVKDDYNTEYTNREWCGGVIDHVRKVKERVVLREGANHLTIYAGEPGMMLERIILMPAGVPLPESYLGPEESPRCPSDAMDSTRSSACCQSLHTVC